MLKLGVFFSTLLFFFTSVQSQEKVDTITSLPLKKVDRFIKIQEKYYNLGNFKIFKTYTDSILTFAKKHHLKEVEIDALIKLGVYYKKTNAYEQSLPFYLEALELSKELNEKHKKQTSILINLGNLYNQIGYSNKATNAFNQAIQFIDQFNGADEYKFAIYIGLSKSSSANKNFKASLIFLEKAKEIGKTLQRNDMLITTYNAIGSNYLQLKKYEKSLAYSNKAKALFTNKSSIENNVLTLYTKGASLVGLKKYEDAVFPLQMAQSMAFTNNYLKIQMNTHQQLARAFEKLGNLGKANAQQKGYIHTQKKYLLSLSKAKRLEVEKDLLNKEELLKKEEKSKWTSILVGVSIITFLLILLFVYIKKKKQIQLESNQLKEDQLLLKDENEALKSKIYKLSQRKASISVESNKASNSIKKSNLTQEEKDKYVQHILEYMEKEKPYLDHEIKQSFLAEKLGMSVHLFSEVLNVCFEKNFNSFINLYRVDRAKQLMKNPKYKHYKVLAIGYESGFPSKTSFNRVFKKLVEQTPSQYRQKQLV